MSKGHDAQALAFRQSLVNVRREASRRAERRHIQSCFLFLKMGKQVATPWRGETVQDLWNEYHKIFRYGNR
jgi:hypothetical protein